MTAAPTTTPTTITRAVLAEKGAGYVVLTIPGTDYKLRLETSGTIGNPVGKRVLGVIRAQARRIDAVHTGGRYFEPLYGRPRRVQGTVESTDANADTVSVRVHESVVFVCKTDERQRASAFMPGELVSMDVEPGARFEGE